MPPSSKERDKISIIEARMEVFQNVGEVPSPIYLGRSVTDLLEETIHEHEFDHLFVVTDEVVGRIHGNALGDALPKGEHQFIKFPEGEASKSLANFEQLVKRVLDAGITKRSIILAFGGGVVGNVAGFLAGTLFRGIRFAHIPTTFQAQTDSVLSRKQALNCQAKNIIGCFHTPLFTFIDTAFLETEPDRYLISGVAESIKNAVISDETFYNHLIENLSEKMLHDPEGLHELVLRSILTKLAILQRDPSEQDEALILEYGHTLAHALETLADGALTHGECVSIGMVFNARLSRMLGLLPKEQENDARSLLERIGLPTCIPAAISSDRLIETMRFDNKRRGHEVEFVLLEATCRPHFTPTGYCRPVEETVVAECMEACRA
ncbi:MAG: iron-containing alcohol dehydrogenase [Planctomycetota bacterium]|jgi:3-dehydroquinate synthase|nr:iron-containing alcohol dehydrogenase [Planctomycetota bacterium]